MNKIRKHRWSDALCLFIVISVLLGCSTTEVKENIASGTFAETKQDESTKSDITQDEPTTQDSVVEADMFTNRDYETDYEESECTKIVLADSKIEAGDGVEINDSTAVITKEGTYLVIGSLENGQIIVNADENAKVRLILANVTIECNDSAPIYVKSADKVFITMPEGSSSKLTSYGEYTEVNEEKNITADNIDAVIFSKADLTLNGEGSLEITSKTGNGITSKDDLIVTGGNYTVNAGNHTLEGKDSVRIAAGVYELNAVADGIHSDNSEDTEKGFVYISDGEMTINAADDGIHAETSVTIDGGTIAIINGCEGIEGSIICINNGDINVFVSDDGLNAVGGNDNNNILITGGVINIDAGGDGVDSNGNIHISGGETYVSGPILDKDGALDYTGIAEITGGLFAAAGSSGMAMNFTEDSTQCAILVFADSMQNGAAVLIDTDGNELFRFTPAKEYSSIVISIPQIEKNGTYTVNLGEETQEIVLDGILYGRGMGAAGMMDFNDEKRSEKMGDFDVDEEEFARPDETKTHPDGTMTPPNGKKGH